ncbi:hypothetical protein Tco_1062824 [Tanacetum coccineum]
MASSITRFNIKKFDGKNDFGLWQIKMRALMVQLGCDAALETLPADMEAGEKAALMKKAYSILFLCLGDQVLLEVTKETTAVHAMPLVRLFQDKLLAKVINIVMIFVLKGKLAGCFDGVGRSGVLSGLQVMDLVKVDGVKEGDGKRLLKDGEFILHVIMAARDEAIE